MTWLSTVTQLWGHADLRSLSKQWDLGGPERWHACSHFTGEETEALKWSFCACYQAELDQQLKPLPLPWILPATPLGSTALPGFQSRQLGLGMHRVLWGVLCLDWGAEEAGSRCRIMGPLGEVRGAGATHGGGEVVIVHSALVGPEQAGDSCGPLGPPWLTLRGHQDAWAQAHSQAPPLGPRNPVRLP